MPPGRRPREAGQTPKDHGTQRLGFIPYGQYATKLSNLQIARIRAYWSRREHLVTFGEKYPSFEMWCAMTCYKPNTDDGGDQFQKLMQFLLVGDSNLKGVHAKKTIEACKEFSPQIERIMQQKDHLYFDAKATRYGQVFRGEDFGRTPVANKENWDDSDTNGESLSTRDADGNYESAGAHVSAHCRPLSLNRDNKYGLFMGTTQNSDKNSNDSIGRNTGVGWGFLPLSIADFMHKAGLLDNFAGQSAEDKSPKNNAMYQYKNCGVDTTGSCWEIGKTTRNKGPCMQIGNKLAAYFGLYYYKDCEHEEFNWNVYEESAAGVHTVRLRCPNPMYGKPNWYDAKQVNPFETRGAEEVLYVYEPLNAYNKKQLQTWFDKNHKDEEREHEGKNFKARDWTYVGGRDNRRDTLQSKWQHKFEVPRCMTPPTYDKPSHSPWASLLNKNNRAIVSPFWLPNATQPESLAAWYYPSSKSFMSMLLHERLRGLDNVSRLQKVGESIFGFGFRVPAAFLFWPNYTQRVFIYESPPNKPSPMPQYMREPQVNKNLQLLQ